MLHRVARLAIIAPRRTIAVAVLLLSAAAIFGTPVANRLSPNGFEELTAAASQLVSRDGRSGSEIAIPLSFLVFFGVIGGLLAAVRRSWSL